MNRVEVMGIVVREDMREIRHSYAGKLLRFVILYESNVHSFSIALCANFFKTNLSAF